MPKTTTQPKPAKRMLDEEKGDRLIRLAMTSLDFEAIDAIAKAHGETHRANAVRLALTIQRQRDAEMLDLAKAKRKKGSMAELVKLLGRGRYQKAVAKVWPGLGRRSVFAHEVGELKQWSAWMYAENLATVQKILAAWNLGQQSCAFRLSIRLQAEVDGFSPAAWMM